MKDPAFLFYYQDFLVGTDELTNEETGAYIRCLCHQAHKGFITEKHMKNICNSYDIHNVIKNKFIYDENIEGYINLRLKTEIEKRQKYSESRSNNRKCGNKEKKHMKNISKSYVKHMENENENENINNNKKVKEKSLDFGILKPELWNKWIDFKQTQFKFKYKSAASEQTGINNLIKLSNGNNVVAELIINQSIGNGWQGLFPLKNEIKNEKSEPKINRTRF
jgi:uncharacterized protein YdaU (DUF1376 family)